jgi:HKD family nuclease
MLDFKNDRLDYGRLLMPPPDYVLTKAIGTTYSLDLNTLLAIPVALFYSKELSGDFTKDKYDVLDAIQKTADVVSIYCQKGKIKVPKKENKLFAFLEDCIHEVIPPIENSSFHPKVWVLRYEKEEEIAYRIIVLSRNLTFDRSWDLAVSSDGKVGKRNIKDNTPIIDFLQYLNVKDQGFLEELKRVEFELPEGFDSLKFHPIGVDKYTNPVKKQIFNALLVLSPFVDKPTLDILKKVGKRHRYLFSREEELRSLPEAGLDKYESYYLNPLIVDGETRSDEGEEEAANQNLHAKLFIGTTFNDHTWFLGSANATAPAFSERNIEFMVEMSTGRRANNAYYMTDALMGSEEHPIFLPYQPSELSETERPENSSQLIRHLYYQIIKMSLRAKAVLNKDKNNYEYTVQGNFTNIEWDEPTQISLSLFGNDMDPSIVQPGATFEHTFKNIALINLSAFIKVKISHRDESSEFLVKLAIAIPDNRNSEIFRNLIDSSQKFFDYLKFLLADNPYEENNEIGSILGLHHGDGLTSLGYDIPILEKLLLACSRDQQKINSIDKIIDRLRKESANGSKEIIPDAFSDMWEVIKTFKQVV